MHAHTYECVTLHTTLLTSPQWQICRRMHLSSSSHPSPSPSDSGPGSCPTPAREYEGPLYSTRPGWKRAGGGTGKGAGQGVGKGAGQIHSDT